MTYYIQTINSFISPQERARLVGLCATITGSSEAAEDLAQETLLEAWRHLEGLNDPEKRSQWLSGIARNVCLRWKRKRGRDLAHSLSLEASTDQKETCSELAFPDPYDLEIELERKELTALLDCALAALPPETRIALVQHYVDESPLAEIAGQLGTNASAIAMRLQRGKLALRRVLTTQMQGEFEPYGFSLSACSTWETTRLWCELCGQHHLLGRLDPEHGSLELKCPLCCRDAGVVFVEARYPALLQGVSGYKRALARLAAWEPSYYRMGIKQGSAACITCGAPMRLCRFRPGSAPSWSSQGEVHRSWGSDQRHSVAFICEGCETLCLTRSNGIARWEPATQQFLRTHPRVRTLPECEIEVDGRSALVTSLESLTDNARLDLILDLETYETVCVSGGQA
jgi:RNA polymerase sigma factor (sigma-70 family)